jgi:hypothetical protein
MMWRSIRWAVCGAFAFSLLVLLPRSAAQDASAQFASSKGEPLVGEPFELTLTVNAPADADITPPEYPSEWSPFVVRRIGEAQIDRSAGRAVLRQTLTVILWEPGDYQTPPLLVRYQITGGSPQEITVQPAFITVPSVLKTGDTTLRPLKPQASLPYFPPWWLLIPAAGLVLVGAWFWRRRQMPVALTTGTRASETPASAALLAFQQADTLHPTAAFAALSDGLRRYIGRRFQLHAEEMTTEELARALKAKAPLSERRQRELHHLLQQADLVKFAPIEPSQQAAARALGVARGWVEAVEREQPEPVE